MNHGQPAGQVVGKCLPCQYHDVFLGLVEHVLNQVSSHSRPLTRCDGLAWRGCPPPALCSMDVHFWAPTRSLAHELVLGPKLMPDIDFLPACCSRLSELAVAPGICASQVLPNRA